MGFIFKIFKKLKIRKYTDCSIIIIKNLFKNIFFFEK